MKDTQHQPPASMCAPIHMHTNTFFKKNFFNAQYLSFVHNPAQRNLARIILDLLVPHPHVLRSDYITVLRED